MTTPLIQFLAGVAIGLGVSLGIPGLFFLVALLIRRQR